MTLIRLTLYCKTGFEIFPKQSLAMSGSGKPWFTSDLEQMANTRCNLQSSEKVPTAVTKLRDLNYHLQPC